MELKYLIIAGIALIAMLVCGCMGVSIVIPSLNNELPAGQLTMTADPSMASDPVVGTWMLVNPVYRDGEHTIEMNDSRWTFGADGSYEFHPLLIDLLKTTGQWAKIGTDRYEIVSGKDCKVEHFRLADGKLCSEEDQRHVLVRC